jgi:hypothetical protein
LLCMEKKINNREDQFYEENTINQTMDWANQNHCNPCCKQTFEIFKIERYWWGWRAPCKPRRRVLKQGENSSERLQEGSESFCDDNECLMDTFLSQYFSF